MYKLVGYRVQQVRSCTYQKVKVILGDKTFTSSENIIQTLKKSGYDEVEQTYNGTNTNNLFFFCRSKSKYPLGHKFHEIHVTAVPI